MKRIFLFAVLLIGCDETTKFLDDLNEAPQINFTNNPDEPVLSDSIKLSFKNSQVRYRITLKVTDKNRNISQVIYTQLNGKGTLKQGGVDIVDNNISFKRDSSTLSFDYEPEVLGLHKLSLKVVDSFGLSNTVSIQIVAFDNLIPVARLNFTRLGTRSRNEYELRGGESFDRDARYGGTIEEYEFTVLGKILPILATTDSKIRVVFPDKTISNTNIYPIALRVRDNDGKWSTLIEREVNID